MNAKRNLAAAVVAVAVALSLAPPASAAVVTYDAGDVPFYARISNVESLQVFHDGTWAVIVFYRPPSCVPSTFDLLTFFDFGAFGCDPETTEGVNIWEHGPGLDPAPTLALNTGLGAVPVWFVPWSELEPALAGGLPMAELASLSRLEGLASSFQQVLRPHGTNEVPMTSFVARGALTDGRLFSARGLFVEGATTQTRITFS